MAAPADPAQQQQYQQFKAYDPAAAYSAPVPSSSAVPPPVAGPKPYHKYKWLLIQHPKYGNTGEWFPVLVHNLAANDVQAYGQSRSVPLVYHHVDPANGVDIWTSSFTLSTPMTTGMRTPFGVNRFVPKNPKPNEKPRWSVAVAFESKDGGPEEHQAYMQFRADFDARMLELCRQHYERWYPNVRPTVSMGSFTIPKIDYVCGKYKASCKERTSADKDGNQRTWPPQISFGCPFIDGNATTPGHFKDVFAFDIARQPIDPVTVNANALIVVMHSANALYLMPDSWGVRETAQQIIKLGDPTPKMSQCALPAGIGMPPPVPAGADAAAAPPVCGWQAEAAAGNQPMAM